MTITKTEVLQRCETYPASRPKRRTYNKPRQSKAYGCDGNHL